MHSPTPTASDIKVLIASDAHLIAARDVFERAFAAHRGIYHFTGAAAARQEHRFREGTRLVAFIGESLVGTLQYRLDAAHIHLLGIAADPAFQKRGIARAMIDAVARRAHALGHRKLTLDTIAETGNVRIFERLGFEVVRSEFPTDCTSDRHTILHLITMERHA